MPELTIAIDGPGSSGKGTIARGVAKALGFQYVDTGAMYRAVALMAMRAELDLGDEDAISALAEDLMFSFQWHGGVLRIQVNDEDITSDIRSDMVGSHASKVSVHPKVRTALLGLQREMGQAGGVVMDGRDIGTVVLPDAGLKIYLDAAPEERARRRHEELLRRGQASSFKETLARLMARDKQDMERDTAPLCQAEDALAIDSTRLTIPQAIELVLGLARSRQTS